MSNQNNPKITVVDCPTCKTEVEWIEKNKHRPFCSDRCQLIDLGGWASEEFKIPGKPATEWDLDEVTLGNETNTLQ